MPEQALGWLPLGLGLVVEDKLTALSCTGFSVLDTDFGPQEIRDLRG